MKKSVILLLVLISLLLQVILSYETKDIWHYIYLTLGMLTYFMSTIAYAACTFEDKELKIGAYIFIAFLIILGGHTIYYALIKFSEWSRTWSLNNKILIPCIIGSMILVTIVYMINKFLAKEKYRK